MESAIDQYFVNKYPQYAALKNWNSAKSQNFEESLRNLGQLQDASPVSTMVNSFPGRPFMVFTERTELSEDQYTATSVQLYSNEDGTCRIVVVENKVEKQDGVAVAKAKPVTEEELRSVIKNAAPATK